MTQAPAVGFVATKPLQIITSMIVARQLDLGPATLSVVPTFDEAAAVIARLHEHDTGFADVHRARHRTTALVALARRGASYVLLDSDVGLRTPVAMWLARALRPDVRLALYEEGLSLLEPDPDQHPNRVFAALGAVCSLGEGRLTQEIWTYSPDAVRARLPQARCVRRIETSVQTFMAERRDVLAAVFWPSREDEVQRWSGRRCCLYLSSWQVEPRVFDHLDQSGAFTVCKFHPHLRDVTVRPRGVAQVVPAAVPAELLILDLAEAFDDVEVWHHGSTVAHYVSSPRVRFRHVDEVLGHSPADPP